MCNQNGHAHGLTVRSLLTYVNSEGVEGRAGVAVMMTMMITVMVTAKDWLDFLQETLQSL